MDWNNTSIEEALTEDIDFITQLYNSFLGDANMDDESIQNDYYRSFLKNKDEREKLYILKLNSKRIGWSQIKKYSHKKGYQYSCETSTYLISEYHNLGLGSKFKKYVMNQCASLGYKHIVAKILSKNQKSIEYNLKLGYEIVGVQKSIGWIGEEWLDVTIMQYVFP